VRSAGSDPAPQIAEALGRMTAHLSVLRRMSLSIARRLQAGETPNLEAALVKELGNAFERSVPETARLVGPAESRAAADRLEEVLRKSILHAPSWSLRGGTREILRGIIARGLGLR
jgi:alkylation response protein AidB-like acyl-CoA dehydrogenase